MATAESAVPKRRLCNTGPSKARSCRILAMRGYYSNHQKEFLRDRRDEYVAAGHWDATDDRCWDRLADDFRQALDAGIVERRSNVDNWSNARYARSCAAKNWRRKGLD